MNINSVRCTRKLMKWILNGFELFSKTNARWAQNTYSNKLNLNQIIHGGGGINKQQQKINQIAWTNHWMLVLFFHNTCWCSLILDYFISHSEINSQNQCISNHVHRIRCSLDALLLFFILTDNNCLEWAKQSHNYTQKLSCQIYLQKK